MNRARSGLMSVFCLALGWLGWMLLDSFGVGGAVVIGAMLIAGALVVGAGIIGMALGKRPTNIVIHNAIEVVREKVGF